MSFIHRILGRKAAPAESERTARENPGPLTAVEALELALAEARTVSESLQLAMVTSGTDMQAHGRSFSWDFVLRVADRAQQVLVSVYPDPKVPDVDTAAICVKHRVSGMGGTPSDSLPLQFKDSTGAVAELSAAGADFVSGPTDMKLESGFSADGKAVWISWCWDKRYEVPFARAG